MFRFIFSLLFLCILFVSSVQAQSNDRAKHLHVVEPGQTLYFISTMYKMSVEEVKSLNPEIGEQNIIKPGQTLVVWEKEQKPEVTKAEYHVIKPGETLFSIAKQYNTHYDSLIQINNLSSAAIREGDSIMVRVVETKDLYGVERPKDVAEVIEVEEDTEEEKTIETNPVETEVTEDQETLKQYFEMQASSGGELIRKKGISGFTDPSGDSFLALVEGVPEGSWIRVRNLMNNRVVYVKVVGALPNNDKQRNLSLKISQSAADYLNVIEERFLAEWSYYR